MKLYTIHTVSIFFSSPQNIFALILIATEGLLIKNLVDLYFNIYITGSLADLLAVWVKPMIVYGFGGCFTFSNFFLLLIEKKKMFNRDHRKLKSEMKVL